MSLAPACPPLFLASRHKSDDRLTTLLEDLGTLGIRASIDSTVLAGVDEDVRLLVWRDDGEAVVELLWCCPDEPSPMHTDAVRVLGPCREVWRHPRARCRPAETARFLADLLLLDDPALSRHYVKLG